MLRTVQANHPFRVRRAVFFALVTLSTLLAMTLLASVYQKDGLTPIELVMLVLYAILMTWLSLSFWTAIIGFFLLVSGRDRFNIARNQAPKNLSGTFRTALVMPVYNEEPKRIFAGLAAICDDLATQGASSHFDCFVLSDTRDPDLWVEEELRWRALADHWEGRIAIHYRNREKNVSRKVGNLKDFCTRWGAGYRYMIVLDADSVMAADTLIQMVRVMENNPQVGLLQTPPLSVNKESLFARLLQFAGRVYSPLYTAGLNYWQLSEGNYWGHNAIIRTRAFTECCGLPPLPGREPFGGEILSHDFVESALLRRAGWEIWLAYDLEGSYEELPPTLIDYAKRDRRWAQGNLQHTRLLLARGFHPVSRLHLLMGILSYLSSPLWLMFLVVTGVDAYLRAQISISYFLGYSLFPVWPPSYTVEMTTVLVVTLFMLFLPKFLALGVRLWQPRDARLGFGGAFWLTAGVILETLVSVLLAPILMLFQTKFVVITLLRRNVVWSAQQRDDRRTGLLEAISAHGGQTFLGVVAGWLSYRYATDFFWWLIPVLSGMVLSIPLSMLLSSPGLGRLTRSWGLFLTPEEHSPPPVLAALQDHLARPEQGTLALPGSRFLQALAEPAVHGLHAALLSSARIGKRDQHTLQGLIYKLLEEGPRALTAAEKRALLSDRETFLDLHRLVWSLPDLTGSLGHTRL
ncbi:MAG: glucans biosynthesis glucosyltransferase MdoH [Pseudomonadota bacterium]